LVRAEVPSTDRIEDLLAAWQVTTLSPAIAVVELSKAGATFWLGFDGPAETVQWQSSVARTVLTDLGGQEATIDSAAVTRADLAQRLAGRVGAVTVLRASVLPSDILTYWHQADEMLAEKGVEVTSIAQIHHGTMWLSLTSETSPNWASLVSGLREKARSLGGNLVVERIPDEVAPVVDSFGLDAASLTLMKRLKRGLDPDDRLAPGRMWRES